MDSRARLSYIFIFRCVCKEMIVGITNKEKCMDAKTPVNRLAQEASPYLRQHAHNPVDWYPWGPEALERALRENKPIFLSIGYSTCHWCHVMAHECFENPDIAAIMNEHFVSIKVDREERPDLDETYMNAVHLLDRPGRLADECLSHPGAQALLWGHLFSPGRPGRVAGVSPLAPGLEPGLPPEPGTSHRLEPPGGGRPANAWRKCPAPERSPPRRK